MVADDLNPCDYETLDEYLIIAGTPFSPAFFHGNMVALLCISHGCDHDLWQTIQQSYAFLENSQSQIFKLFKILFFNTKAQFEADEIELDLMLPAEELPISHRLESLSDWCEGFLQQLTTKQPEQLLRLPEVQEIVADFAQIKEVSSQEDDSEENERAYTEMVEFVKIGALLIREESLNLALSKQ